MSDREATLGNAGQCCTRRGEEAFEMLDGQSGLREPPLSLISVVVARTGRMALVVAGRTRWRDVSGYTLIPAELPADVKVAEAPTTETIAQITRQHLSREARPLASRYMYGTSAVHAIDRLDASAEPFPLPLLHIERGMSLDVAATPAIRRVQLRTYRAALAASAIPGEHSSGILWLTPEALRLAMRGAPLAELLAEADVAWEPATHVMIPDNAFVFVPADYGERYILRIVAKYGHAALFQGDDGETNGT